MAQKTIVANGSRGHHKFTVTLTETSTDTAKNVSYCSVSAVLSSITTGYDWKYSNSVPVTITVTVNGQSFKENIMSYDGRSSVTVLSKSNIEVPHNDDGTKTVSFSVDVWSANVSFLPGSAWKSDSLVLTEIPRKAILTSADSFSDGQNPTIWYECKSPSIITALDACISFDGINEGIKYRAVDKHSSSYTFQLTSTELSQLRNACGNGNSATITYFLRSTIEGQYHYSSIERTFTIQNGQPIVNAFAEETNQTYISLTGSRNKIIKGHNSVRAWMSASGQKGASIVETVISNGGVAQNTTNTYFENTKSNAFSFYAEDSRGNATQKQVVLTMVDYIDLTCVATINPPDVYGSMSISAEGNCFNGSFGAVANTLAVEYRLAENNGQYSAWQPMSATKSTNTYNASKTITGLNYRSKYKVQIRATDKVMSALSNDKSVHAIPVFDWGANDFNFNVDVKFNGELLRDMVYPIGSIYFATSNVEPSILFGGTWERYAQGRVLVGVDETQTEFNTVGKLSGEKEHTLTVDEMPSHAHRPWFPQNATGSNQVMKPMTDGTASEPHDSYLWSETTNTGGDKPHNNLQPGVAVYIWRRIA